jgi:hypothetical protein
MTIRLRTKGSSGNGSNAKDEMTRTGYVYFPWNGTWFGSAPTNTNDYLTSFDTRESIEDRVHEQAELKPVSHTSYKCDFRAIPNWIEWTFTNKVHAGSPRNGTMRQTSSGSTAGVRAKGIYSAGIPADPIALARGRIPRMSPERLSSLNNMYELKDLAECLKRIPVHIIYAAYRRRWASARVGVREWLLQLEHDLLGNPNNMLLSLVNQQLAWKFGWKPFIADAVKTIQAVRGADSQLTRYMNVPFTVAGSASVSQATRFGPFTELGSIYTVKSTDVVVNVERRRVSGLRVKLKPSFLKRPDAVKLLLLQEQLGFTPTAEKVWAAVPYSFVVDWFIPVSQFLEQFNALQINSSMFNVSSYWESELMIRTVDATTKIAPAPNSDASVTGSFLVPNQAKHVTRTYTRTVGSGKPGYSPDLYFPPISLPRVGQWVTGAELAIQKLLRSTPRFR